MEQEKEVKKSQLALMEEGVLAWWNENDVFGQVLSKRKKGKPFIFYEGPPTANGMPHPGHVMGRCFKDLFLRYKSMRGYFVPRHAGWDTHGLPVEIEIEKKLGITKKSDIEKFGVGAFNRLCKESVWKYKDEWEKMTQRIGFWLDMKHPYVTYEVPYMETLWWVIARIFEKGLLVEDYKVIPYCTRCGTGLSSHEIAQGYKTVKDKSVYVKFPVVRHAPEERMHEKAKHKVVFDEHEDPTIREYFLVWTTTPWTLPANVALAVNPDIEYVKAKKENEIVIVAKNCMHKLGEGWEGISTMKGKELLGMRYEQLFTFLTPDKDAFYVVGGDFVSASDGSGIVHLAPAYGVDDMEAAKKHDLPVLHPVQASGEFAAPIPWQGVFVKNTDKAIVGDLTERGLFFKEEVYEHEYPFCWRCDTPIIYYARKSWFITMSQLREKLIENNKKVNWVPSHIKEGRFGEWLSQAKDWAFSRERYWGTPLPIWRCDGCEHIDVVGSIADLGARSQLRNTYFMMRHGQAVFNAKHITETSGRAENHITKKGIQESKDALVRFAKKHKGVVPDIIIASPFLRTQETARSVAEYFGLTLDHIVTDAAIQEMDIGVFDGKPTKQYHAHFSSHEELFTKRPPEARENLTDLRTRIATFIRETERRYEGKVIFIVSHEYSLWMLETALYGYDQAQTIAAKKKKGEEYIATGEIRTLPRMRLPLDESGFLDLHKPYIDEITFSCRSCEGGIMRRVPEVCDVWFDSGAMPLAQAHFPFEQEEKKGTRKTIAQHMKQISYPADFICEGVDQTRGWFYTLLAIATALGGDVPYRNVISQGHILDKHGKKMSKSKRNYTDPLMIADQYGIDALRWYFFVVNPVGEPKRLDEKDVLDAQRKSVMTLINIGNFLTSYAYMGRMPAKMPPTKNLLDRWIISKLNHTVAAVTDAMDAYDAQGAGRHLAALLEDISNWYIRRSRERFQLAEDARDHKSASIVLRMVFERTLILAAPFIPFTTERLWLNMNKKTSIHLERYPAWDKKRIDKKLEYDMMQVREAVSAALKARAEARIKVRQPLGILKLSKATFGVITKDLLRLLEEEVNIKEVVIDDTLAEGVWLDTMITPALKEEGMMREITRHIQQARKEAGLMKEDAIMLRCVVEGETKRIIEEGSERLLQRIIAKKIEYIARDDMNDPREIKGDEYQLWFEIKKI
ncbi:MAG: class I tRNA ligase family protein [Candidatus Azambacteria bacterium]|nr:class I tRNA ligase family protein [Candidatus Azambacteria bacterium]